MEIAMTRLRLSLAALALSAVPALAGGLPAFDLPRLDFGPVAGLSTSGPVPVPPAAPAK
jgi:hypothetical protein